MTAGTPVRTLPLVALICRVPLVCEAVSETLTGIAESRSFPAERGETAGLLHWLRPDAVVVDSAEEAREAAPFARETGATLVHVSLRPPRVYVLTGDGWHESDRGADGTSAQSIRNIIVAGLFGRERMR